MATLVDTTSFRASRKVPVLDRVADKYEVADDGCWMWLLRLDRGYGKLSDSNGRFRKAHRVIWEEMVGPVPAGLELDHLCGHRSCVNPDHLEPVTHAENVRRASLRKETCKYGHPYGDRYVYTKRDGSRDSMCRPCAIARAAARHARLRGSA